MPSLQRESIDSLIYLNYNMKSNVCTILSLAPLPPDRVQMVQYGVGRLVVLWYYWVDYGYDSLTEFIIYYWQQERLSVIIESNLQLFDWYRSQKATISGLIGGGDLLCWCCGRIFHTAQ